MPKTWESDWLTVMPWTRCVHCSHKHAQLIWRWRTRKDRENKSHNVWCKGECERTTIKMISKWKILWLLSNKMFHIFRFKNILFLIFLFPLCLSFHTIVHLRVAMRCECIETKSKWICEMESIKIHFLIQQSQKVPLI